MFWIKKCFQAGLEHKTRKDLEAFLKAGIVPKKGELKTLFQYQLGNGRAN